MRVEIILTSANWNQSKQASHGTARVKASATTSLAAVNSLTIGNQGNTVPERHKEVRRNAVPAGVKEIYPRASKLSSQKSRIQRVRDVLRRTEGGAQARTGELVVGEVAPAQTSRPCMRMWPPSLQKRTRCRQQWLILHQI